MRRARRETRGGGKAGGGRMARGPVAVEAARQGVEVRGGDREHDRDRDHGAEGSGGGGGGGLQLAAAAAAARKKSFWASKLGRQPRDVLAQRVLAEARQQEGKERQGQQVQPLQQQQQQQQHEGLFVWVVGSTTNVYEMGKLVNLLPDSKFEVAMVESGDTRSIARRLLFPASEKDPLETSDLTQLDFINEANLLWALQKRTEADLPYSFIGPVLVAVNPLIAIPDPEGVEAGATSMPHVPHPYTLAERMLLQLELSQLQGHPRSQSVIISGESGSGKTVTAKMVLQHVVRRAFPSRDSTTQSIRSDCPLDERLLQANPILEAFGNASTLRNDNSSRFGKFFKLFFDEDGNVDGATLETYLLERSRVTRHVHGERNFHIFYALLAGDASHMGVDEAFLERLGLVDRDFNYAKMRNGARSAALLAKDLETLEHIVRAFSSIGIADDASERILETLAGLLHLGNLVFVDEGSAYDGEQAELIADSDALVHLCALWGLASHAEASRLLCERTIKVGRETTRVPLSVGQAQKARDAVAKDVYARLFQWICARVNRSLEGPASVAASFTDMPFVGVLDIFGFESFEQNGLEQLLINYANERLQASFNMHILQDEADLYMREGLVSAGLYSRARGFSESPRRGLRAGSNSPAVPRVSAAASDVIEEVLELLDEEAQRLDGSDLGLNRRIQDQLASNKSLRTPHPSRRAEQFIIAHTAGHVTYTVGTFLERNDDVLPKETLDVLRRVDNQVLAEAFTDARSHTHARSSKSRHKTGARNAGKQLSVSGKFVCQIEDLVEGLDATSCSYVRCIKPNPIMRRDDPEKDIPASTAKKRSSGKKAKSADDATPSFPWFDRRYVSAQIKSLCLPQAALTLRDGLPVRLHLDELMSILDPAIQGPVERACHSHGLGRTTRFLPVMLGAFGVESSAYRLGATQVFFHNDQVDQLQTALRRIDHWVGDDSQVADDRDYLQWSEEVERSLIRQRWRIVIAAVRFFNKFNLPLMERENREQAALLLQRNLRALIKRRHLLRLRKAAITGQRLYRGAKGRERALDRIAEVEANEALLKDAAIADQEMSPDLEDENNRPRVYAGSTSENSRRSQSQPRGSFHSRSQSRGSLHSRSHSGGSSAAASYSSSLYGRKRLSQSQGTDLATDEPTPARTLTASVDSASHRRSSSVHSSITTTERSSRRSSRSLISSRINESLAGPSRFERVRKMSMIGAHFDENAFSRALADAQEEDERREENLSRSYTQDPSVKEPPREPPLAERPRSIVRASLKSAPQTGASGDVLDAAADRLSETNDESRSCIACVLGIVKRTPWKRRYLVLDPSARSVSIYAQRKGQGKLNSCIDVFRVLPADFNPPPRMDASHDEYEMDNFEFEAPSTPITLLRSRARPGRYRLRITGGRADHDALQETRTLTVAFDQFDEMDAWRNVFTKLLEPSSQNSGFKHDRVLLESAMRSALHEDAFSDAESSLYQESTIFGAQIRCKNPECQQVNNSLYGMACIVCGWSLSLHGSEDAADDFSGDANEDDLDSLPPSISMQRRPVRTNRWLQMGDGAASDDDDDSFF